MSISNEKDLNEFLKNFNELKNQKFKQNDSVNNSKKSVAKSKKPTVKPKGVTNKAGTPVVQKPVLTDFEKELRKTARENYVREEPPEEKYEKKIKQLAKNCAEHFKMVCLAEAGKGNRSVSEYANYVISGENVCLSPDTSTSTFGNVWYYNTDYKYSMSFDPKKPETYESTQIKEWDRSRFIRLLDAELKKLGFSNFSISTKEKPFKIRKNSVVEEVGFFRKEYVRKTIETKEDVQGFFLISAKW